MGIKNYIFHSGNISNQKFVEKTFSQYKIEKVFHLAAQAGVRYSLEKPRVYVEANISGFLNILEAIRNSDHKIKLITASSSSVYGNSKMPANGFSEEQKLNKPISMYAATKLSNELMSYTYHKLFKINVISLRFFYSIWTLGKTRIWLTIYFLIKLLITNQLTFITMEK